MKTDLSSKGRAALYLRAFGLLLGGLLFVVGVRANHTFGQSLWSGRALGTFVYTGLVIGGVAAGALIFAGRWVRLILTLGLSLAIVIAFGMAGSAAVAFVMLSSLALGDLIGGAGLRESWEPLTAAIIATVAGIAVFVLGMGIVAHYRVNFAALYTIVLIVPIIGNFRGLQAHLAIFKQWIQQRERPDFWSALFGTILTFLLVVQIVEGASPERYADALALHLFIPTTIESLGRWHFDVATHSWATAPMAADFGYAIAYVLGGELAAKLLNLFSGFLIAGLVFSVSARITNRAFALGLACVFLSIPVSILESATLFIDNALTVFLFAGFVVALRFFRLNGDRARVAVLATLLCAAAMATKLPAVFLAGPIGIAVTAVMIVRLRSRALAPLGIIGLVALLGLLPYIYAYYMTGNPVFPLENGVFKSPFYPAVNFAPSNYPGALSLVELYKMTFHSHLYVEGADGVIGFQFIILLFIVLFSLLMNPISSSSIYFVVGILYVTVVSMNSQYIRYVFPAFTFLIVSISCINPINNVVCRRGKLFSSVLCFSIICIIGVNLAVLPSAGWILRNFDLKAMFRPDERQAMLMRDAPIRSLVSIVNALSGNEARVGFIAPPYPAGLLGVPLISAWYNDVFEEAVIAVRNPDDAVRLFRRFQLTHLILSDEATVPYPEALSIIRRAALIDGRVIKSVTGETLIELDESAYFGAPIVDDRIGNGLEAWKLTDGQMPNISEDRSGLSFADPKQIWLPTPIAAHPYHIYKMSVMLTCVALAGSVGLQVNWVDAQGRFLAGAGESRNCNVVGEKRVEARFKAPSNAASAILYVTSPQGTIKNVAFFMGGMTAEGLTPSSIRTYSPP